VSHRTRTHKEADKFDSDLYRLIDRAGQFAQADTGYAGGQWGRVFIELKNARYIVRNLMHPDDRKETVGEV
jgi:hypothetical protein